MVAALDSRLSAAETDALRKIAGTMVPADAVLGMPGADDPAILDDILRSIGRDLPLVREALAAIDAKSGGAFAEMDQAARESLINEWYPRGGASALALGRVIVSAYYRAVPQGLRAGAGRLVAARRRARPATFLARRSRHPGRGSLTWPATRRSMC
jgi:hypothetical protein